MYTGVMLRPFALFVLVVATIATPALAAPDWNGTWAGNWSGSEQEGVQLIMAGNDVIGIYWHGDYLSDDMKSTVSPDGKILSITWKDGGATLTRDGDASARFQIHDSADSAKGELKLDK